MADSSDERRFTGRVRQASISLMNASPQLGIWQATGTAIAHAPNLTELRSPESGGDSIAFNAHGHSARVAVQESNGELTLVRSKTLGAVLRDQSNPPTAGVPEEPEEIQTHAQLRRRRQSLSEKHHSERKEKWAVTIKHGLSALWKFFLTPSGFVIVIYCLNIVAWGAMLFFLLLDAAPAMDHPSADDVSSPRKIWLEIDSQILNALFCVTGFGLAPWRFRDFYFMIRAIFFHDKAAMQKLSAQNKAWFRPPAWAESDGNSNEGSVGDVKDSTSVSEGVIATFTGKKAPPTALWKLAFPITMMALNTIIQAVLSYYMWAYDRINRPSWATGTFIGLGCGVAMLAGLMSWWEGRGVKKIEGPEVKIVENV